MSKSETEKTKAFRSLTVTLAVAFLVSNALALLVMGGLQIYFNLQNLREVVAGRQQLIAEEAAYTVRSFFQEKASILETTVRLGNLVAARPEERKLDLDKLLGLEPAFRQLILFNHRGEELLRDSRLSSQVSHPFSESVLGDMFARASQEKTCLSPIYFDPITSEPMMTMAVSIKDVFGDVEGLLMAEVNLKFTWDLVSRMKLGHKGLAYVVDRRGTLIAFSDISRVLRGENVVRLDVVNRFVNGGETRAGAKAGISKGIQNNYVSATLVALGSPDWAVVVESPVMEAYEGVIRMIALSALIILLSFVSAIVTGIHLSRRITEPIIRLRDATVEIGEGRLDAQVEIEKNDEIGDLARAFNRMTQDMQKTTTSIVHLEREIAERERVEDQIQKLNDELEQRVRERTARLEEMVGELESFSYSVSHDLRAPLRTIDGFSQVVLEDSGDQLGDSGKESLGRIRHAAQKMSRLIDDMQLLSRLARRQMELKPVDLSQEAWTIVNDLRQQSPARVVDVVVEEGVTVHGDRQLLQLAMQNLLGNAWKFTRHCEKARIEFGVMDFASRPPTFPISHSPSGGPVFFVRDNGAGFDMAYAKKMFGAFQRLHTEKEFEGTGIGLAIVQRIMHRHGGRIWAESEVGKGSTFYFTI